MDQDQVRYVLWVQVMHGIWQLCMKPFRSSCFPLSPELMQTGFCNALLIRDPLCFVLLWLTNSARTSSMIALVLIWLPVLSAFCGARVQLVNQG